MAAEKTLCTPPARANSLPRGKFPSCRRRSRPCKTSNLRLAGLLLLLPAMLDGLSNRIERYLDVLSTRQRQVAANIANADTPGYRTRDLDFQSELQRQIGTSGQSSVRPMPVMHEVAGLPVRNDGNNVSLDREARLLAENALRFNVASNLLKSQIRMVRSAIDVGRNA
jgi:flagellar basal-body rod protein FlgB